MNILDIKDFFYVPDRSYDILAEKSLPSYHEAHKILVSLLYNHPNAALDVIDLGVGSGVTSAYILKNYPNARIIGIDLFEEMLCDARARLKLFSDRVALVQSDNSVYLRAKRPAVDVVVSGFCIHHLDEPGKKDLFRLIYESLRPNGRFLMLDLTTFDNPKSREFARQATISHMKAHVESEQYRKEWIHHWNDINIPHPADRMSEWLREAGFELVEIVYRNLEVCLIIADKRMVQ